MSDAFDFGKVIALLYEEVLRPVSCAKELVHCEESGRLLLPIEVCTDAQSVWDALKASELKTPSEASLIMPLSGIKEALLSFTLKKLHWVNTHDMVADGLGKGVISREKLLELFNTGEWKLQHPFKTWTETQHRPIPSSESIVREAASLFKLDLSMSRKLHEAFKSYCTMPQLFQLRNL